MENNTRKSFSAMLRELSSAYYNHQCTFQEFRKLRRDILNRVDLHYNNQNQNNELSGLGFGAKEDSTEPYFLGDTMTQKAVSDADFGFGSHINQNKNSDGENNN